MEEKRNINVSFDGIGTAAMWLGMWWMVFSVTKCAQNETESLYEYKMEQLNTDNLKDHARNEGAERRNGVE